MLLQLDLQSCVNFCAILDTLSEMGCIIHAMPYSKEGYFDRLRPDDRRNQHPPPAPVDPGQQPSDAAGQRTAAADTAAGRPDRPRTECRGRSPLSQANRPDLPDAAQ